MQRILLILGTIQIIIIIIILVIIQHTVQTHTQHTALTPIPIVYLQQAIVITRNQPRTATIHNQTPTLLTVHTIHTGTIMVTGTKEDQMDS